MARPLRVLVENGVYHVTSRGTEKRDIFLDAEDRACFLSTARGVAQDYDWRYLSYCLMPNHFHLVVRTPQANLSRGMQRLKGVYAMRFNRRHDRCGPLFSKRFDARLVQHDEYLLRVLRYVALNPVKDGFCADPLEWRWSAHAVLLGRAVDVGLVDVAGTLELLDEDPEAARAHYAAITAMQDGVEDELAGPVYGDDEFARPLLPEAQPHRDVPRREWGRGRPPLSELLAGGGIDGIERAVRRHGFTFAEVAAVLKCHPVSVSRRLRRYEAERETAA